MAQYSPPEWSMNGRNVFNIYLEVIKNGVIVENVPLPRSKTCSYVVIGRMEDVCDLPLAHPSISRIHAALQFNEQGMLFLYDMNSTHGCHVNKKQVAAQEFVQLHIGDILVFGNSTRLYAVCGPPELVPVEYESQNLARFRDKLEKKREHQEKSKQQQEGEWGASWGFQEDAEEEESGTSDEEEDDTKHTEDLPEYLRNLKDENQPYKSSVSQLQVNEKDQRLYQQLQTRIRKMENIKLERSRILAKQHQLSGLSEGQQRTLDRNEQRMDTLMKEIEDLEGRIHAKNDQRMTTQCVSGTAAKKKRNINDELYGYNSDEDDFYDRTQANQQKFAVRKQRLACSIDGPGVNAAKTHAIAPTSEILTADSIQANVKTLEAEFAKLQEELTAASTRVSDGQGTRKISKQEEQADTLDSFMAEATTQLIVSEAATLTKRKNEVEMELKRQRQLLTVVTPALAALPIQKPLVETIEDTVECSSSNLSSKTRKEPPIAFSAGMKTTTEPDTAEADSHELAESGHTSKPGEVNTVSSDRQKTRPIVSQKFEKMAGKTEPVAPKRRRIAGPATSPSLQTTPHTSSEHRGDELDILKGGDQVWIPPANQTGDGRTKLNDKFGY